MMTIESYMLTSIASATRDSPAGPGQVRPFQLGVAPFVVTVKGPL
ncbi:hypothetical protein N9X64_00090 [bacterium]|nr:hypothetical protein [bacterium]